MYMSSYLTIRTSPFSARHRPLLSGIDAQPLRFFRARVAEGRPSAAGPEAEGGDALASSLPRSTLPPEPPPSPTPSHHIPTSHESHHMFKKLLNRRSSTSASSSTPSSSSSTNPSDRRYSSYAPSPGPIPSIQENGRDLKSGTPSVPPPAYEGGAGLSVPPVAGAAAGSSRSSLAEGEEDPFDVSAFQSLRRWLRAVRV